MTHAKPVTCSVYVSLDLGIRTETLNSEEDGTLTSTFYQNIVPYHEALRNI